MRRGAFEYHLEADRPSGVSLRVVGGHADAATPGGVEDQESKERTQAREEQIFWRQTLQSPVGKRVMAKWLRLAGAFEQSPFAADLSGRLQERLSDYKLGQIQFGHRLYQWLAIVAREELFKLQDELNVSGELAVRPENVDN